MTHLRTLWKISLPIIIAFTILLALTHSMTVRADVTNVSPNSAQQGDTLTVAVTIAAPPNLPPASEIPGNVRIGTLEGSAIQRSADGH